ncbi:hypothetical protein I5907_01265 [Panacibacter sp. DH6]|uniref:Uncharacterized protein n=1 Tax=Panacibacter microcysteis TaxID=2793269 RepID=A0A931GV91_9BACT|nr:hypothetical protein [Panacibacter microcysteis]MBG9374848.1 hypothetical protein [Panacibacter microcysteis]
MKLRFENNTVRIRIRKSELVHLKEHNNITEAVSFPVKAFTYALQIADVKEITPVLSESNLLIQIPVVKASAWIDSDEVGLYHLVDIDNDEALEVMIEKDFPCKERPDEDKTDTFTELAAQKGTRNNC